MHIGCIPTKSLVHQSKLIENKGLQNFQEQEINYRDAIKNKDELISLLRKKIMIILIQKKRLLYIQGKHHLHPIMKY